MNQYGIAYLPTGQWQVFEKDSVSTWDRGLYSSFEEAVKAVSQITGERVLLKVITRDDL